MLTTKGRIPSTAGGSGGARIGSTQVEVENKPGTYMMVALGDLRVDTEYQRSVTGKQVDNIAGDWSWIACGTLTVAHRQHDKKSTFHVIDGQHRLEAARRIGIAEIPCLIFEATTQAEEAHNFLVTNTNRRIVAIINRYRALLVEGDHVALKVKELLTIVGREAVAGGGQYRKGLAGGNYIVCLDFMMRAIEQDEETFARIWPLAHEIADTKIITKDLLSGLFYIERYLSNTSVTDRHWRRRLLQIGFDGLTKSITETKTYEGRSGAAVCAKGILRAVNKGLRYKLTIKSDEEDKDMRPPQKAT